MKPWKEMAMDDKRDQNPAKSSDPQTERRRPHKGSFATGEERRVHHPEEAPPGDFARGQEDEPEDQHKGSFAEGEEDTIEHPEDEAKGDFAEGQEENRR
jgi:hypothetical protein